MHNDIEPLTARSAKSVGTRLEFAGVAYECCSIEPYPRFRPGGTVEMILLVRMVPLHAPPDQCEAEAQACL